MRLIPQIIEVFKCTLGPERTCFVAYLPLKHNTHPHRMQLVPALGSNFANACNLTKGSPANEFTVQLVWRLNFKLEVQEMVLSHFLPH